MSELPAWLGRSTWPQTPHHSFAGPIQCPFPLLHLLHQQCERAGGVHATGLVQQVHDSLGTSVQGAWGCMWLHAAW